MKDFINFSDLIKNNSRFTKKQSDEIRKEIINYFILNKEPNHKYIKLLRNMSKNLRNLAKNLFDAQFLNRTGIVLDFEGVETELKDHEMTIMSAYDILKDKFYFTIDELIENLNNRLLITFNEKYDIYMLMKELTKKGYKFQEDNLLKSKTKKIITRFIIYKDDKKIEFITYDLMHIFASDLLTLSRILKKYLEENELDQCLIPDKIKEILDKYGIEKGISIDGQYFYKETEIKEYLLSKNNIDYFLTEEYKIYNIKDVCITVCLYILYEKIFSRILKTDAISRKKITLPSISYTYLIKETSKLHSKEKKCPKVLKEFKLSYKGGLTYFDRNVYYDVFIYDINSSYPTSMNITGVNIFNPIIEKNIHDLKEEDYILSEKEIKEINECQLSYIKDILNSFYNIENLTIVKKYPQLKTLLYYAINGYYSVVFYGTIKYIDKNSLGFNLRLKKSSCNLVGEIKLEELEKLKEISKQTYKNIYPALINTYINALDIIRCNVDMDIIKVYFIKNNNNTLRKKILDIYNKRIELKNQKNPFEVVLKLIMNSSYGKLGTSLDNNFTISSHEFNNKNIEFVFGSLSLSKNILNIIESFKINDKKTVMVDGIKLRKYYSKLENKFKYEIRSTNSFNTYQTNGYNYLLAGTITAYSKILLETYIRLFEKNGYKNIYNDTDSIIVCKNNPDAKEPVEIVGEKLGLMKKEKTISEIHIFGRKLYAYRTEKNNNYVIKSKGINFVDENTKNYFLLSIKNVNKNEINQIRIDVITKGTLGMSVFKKQTKIINAPEEIANKKTTITEIINYYMKEKLLPDIHVRYSEGQDQSKQ